MTLKIKEQIMTVDVVSDNNRIYPKDEIKKSINEFNEKHKTVGCLCDNTGYLEVDLSKVTHTLDYLELVGDCVMADMTILDTPYGQIIQDVLGRGEVSISSHGMGILTGEKDPYIVNDYSFSGVKIT